MTPVAFAQANTRFGPPPDLAESQCMTIQGYVGTIQGGSLDGSTVVVVAWKPTAEEIARINQGQPIYLSFIGGIPPHFPCMDFDSAINPS